MIFNCQGIQLLIFISWYNELPKSLSLSDSSHKGKKSSKKLVLQQTVNTALCGNLTQQWNKTLCHQKPKLWVCHYWQALLSQHLCHMHPRTKNLNAHKICGSIVHYFFKKHKNKNLITEKFGHEEMLHCYLLVPCSLLSVIPFHLEYPEYSHSEFWQWLGLGNAVVGQPKIYMWLTALYEVSEIL